jgi:hypothetical protein
MSELDELDFWLEPDSHVYTYMGASVPACTATLELARPPLDTMPKHVLAKATQRGRDTHKAVELHAKGDYDGRTGSEAVRSRMRQWQQFLSDYNVEFIKVDTSRIASPLLRALFDKSRLLVEIPLVHPVFHFGVTPDIGLALVHRVPSLIEVKATSRHNRATALQTAAQKATINYIFGGIPGFPKVEGRYGVRLTGHGKADVKPYRDETDWSSYMSFLNVHNFRAGGF